MLCQMVSQMVSWLLLEKVLLSSKELKIENSVEDYNRGVGVVSSVPKFKYGIISKHFELEG